MDAHLDTHFMSFPEPPTHVIGKVRAVVSKDDPGNPTGTFTLYNITVYCTKPTFEADYENVSLLGQCAGGTRENDDPLEVGQLVMVGFRNDDPNLPFILDTFASHDTDVAAIAADQPRSKHNRRGYIEQVDKNGNVDIFLSNNGGSNRSYSIKDSSGGVLVEITDTGGGYRVHLGGNTSPKRLMTEDMVAALKALFDGVTIVPNDGGLAIKTALVAGLNAAFTTSNSTNVSRGQ